MQLINRNFLWHWLGATALLLGSVLCLVPAAVAEPEIIWFDGTRSENPPAGRLLSDNEDYWGEVILTGVEYEYEIEPDQPADDRLNRRGTIGRTLLNGNRGRGNVGLVGLSGQRPLTVVFDFKRICSFSEWNLVTPSRQTMIRLELRTDEAEAWQTVFEQAAEDCPDRDLQRLIFDQPATGRYARLTLSGPSLVQLREVLAWGEAEVDEEHPELFETVATGQYPVGIAYPTITGIAKSSVSDRESFYWVQSLSPEQRVQEAVWTQLPAWESISHQPLLPDPEEVNQPIHITMARNETEAVALALKNTLVNGTRELEVELGEIRTADGQPAANLKASLGVFGVIGDRGFGNNLGPIFEADNLLGQSLMRKYLLNGAEIENFPQLTLPPSGAAVLWLSFTATEAEPGHYLTSVSIAGGQPVPVTVEVLEVTLPTPFAHVKTYSRNRTTMFPFVHADREERDIAYALDSGISDWRADDSFDLLRRLAEQRGMRIMFDLGMLIPRRPDYVGMIWQSRWKTADDLPEDAPERIAETVQEVVARATELGLDYRDWYGKTGDEPKASNIGAVAGACRLIKQADPKVNIYVNPCYWAGFDRGGVSDDQTVAEGLAGWYNEIVDISMPLMLLMHTERPESQEYFSAPRKVNSYYYVSGHLDRSENSIEIQKYRRMAWNSFKWDFNGWAFYAYYSPRGSAWNHFDRNPRGEGLQEPSDYQMVYPGPRGVIRTRHSEALREGWEDYRLLHLLRDLELTTELEELLQAYRDGEPMEELRRRALRAVAR